ncbi:MAG: hypothetical protein RLZZ526_190, partial [Actinomycetota bacterium]
DNQWNSVSISSINTNTSLPATGLVSGTYKAYAVDAAGNLSAASSNSVTVDADLPSVTVTRSGSGTVGGGQDVTVTFTLSKSSTNFAAGDVTVSGGTLSNFSGSGTTYTATWTPPVSGSGTASVSVAANKFTDSVGNNNTASSNLSITWNTNLPSVTITRTGSGTVGGGQDITVTFELSEASTNFTVGDITVSGGTLSNFSGSGTIYTVTWTPPSTGSGTANLSVAANKFTDAANNNNAASSPFSIVWNANLPSLEVTRTGTGSVGIGQNLTLTFTLSEASTNFTVGDITVSGGTLSNFSGSGTTYTATWTPPSGTSGSASISVAAGKFTDAAGNSNTASIALTVAYDTVPPTTTTVDPNSTSSSLAQSSGTLAPAVSTPLFPKKSATKKPTKSSPATTAAPVPTTTTTTIPVPEAPSAELGQAAATIGDEKVETVITRNDNSVVLSMGGLSAMLSGYTSNGSKAALDAEGNLRIARDGKLGMQVKGFKSLSTVEVWLFSDPVKLGDTKTSSAGFAENAFNIPADVPDGRHRAVLSALDPSGDEVTVSLGIIIGDDNSSGPSVISILLLIVLSLALILGLALPATLRRLGAEVPRLRIGVRKAQTVTVIDVRGTSEYEFGHLDEALHIENDENFLSRVLELPHDGTYQVYGTGGNNAALAMRQAGFTDVRYLGEIAAAASATGRRIVS